MTSHRKQIEEIASPSGGQKQKLYQAVLSVVISWATLMHGSAFVESDSRRWLISHRIAQATKLVSASVPIPLKGPGHVPR